MSESSRPAAVVAEADHSAEASGSKAHRGHFGISDLSARYSPGWVLAIVAGPKQADDIAGRVSEPGFPPKPILIGWQLSEREACRLKVRDASVQVHTLEVHDDSGVATVAIHGVK